MTSVEGDLLDGIAQALAAASVAIYSPSGVYTPTETAIYFSLMPPGAEAQPSGTDRAVVLSTYPLGDDANQNHSLIGVQVRTRGGEDPRDVMSLDEAVFNVLHGLSAQQYGTAYVVQLLRRSSIPMGQDAQRRWLRSSNFYADVNTPPGTWRGN